MNSLDVIASVWVNHAWSVFLVFTLALVAVLLLRLPCRRLFGAGQAFQLWLLVPLMLLVAVWPQQQRAKASVLPPVVLRIVKASATLSANAIHANAVNSDWLLAYGWTVGMLAALLLAAGAQWRFRRYLLGAQRVNDSSGRWPIWRAARADVGPALIGLWRVRILVPSDFDTRYDQAERDLILAHETMHARRRDIWLCLIAQLLASAFWFHPLVWWALVRFRHDQELACDAGVLREHGARRRSYARAMLKTQSSRFSLPIGCLWSPRHPITERIAMLKKSHPRPFHIIVGHATLAALFLGLGQLVYAASPLSQNTKSASGQGHAASREANGSYTLRLALSVDGQPVRLRSTECLKVDDYYSFSEKAADTLPAWHGRLTVVPAEEGELEVRTNLSGGSLAKPVSPHIRMRPGQPGGIQIGDTVTGKDGKSDDRTLKLELTAWAGCVTPPAVDDAGDVQFNFATTSARAVAQSIARQGGFEIVNPLVLDSTRPVVGNFEQVPAADAFRLIGHLVGMKPVINGKQVRFEPE